MSVSFAQILKQKEIGIPNKDNNDNNIITFNNLKRARHTRHHIGRLCGDLEIFQKHVIQRETKITPSHVRCVVKIYTLHVRSARHQCTIFLRKVEKIVRLFEPPCIV